MLAACDQADRRRTSQTLFLDIPAEAFQQSIAGRGKTRDMGRLGPGDEGEARLLWQPEELLEPSSGHFFDHSFGGTAGMDRDSALAVAA